MCWLAGWESNFVHSLTWWGPLQQGDLLSSVTIDWCLAPRRWGFHNTHSDAPQSVGLVWTSDQLVPETSQQSQQTNIHAPGGIRTHDLGRRAAVDLRLRPSGHWDRHGYIWNRHDITALSCAYQLPSIKPHRNYYSNVWNQAVSLPACPRLFLS